MYCTSLFRLVNVQKRFSVLQTKVVIHSSYTTYKRTTSTDSPLVLYGDEASPLVRFVLMSASLLEIKLKFKHVDVFREEQMSEKYKKINFLQKVPALQVNKLVINDSHAIALLFCELSDKGRLLYPEEPLRRALVHQFLFFNSSTLFQVDSEIFTEYFRGKWSVDKEKVEKWNRLLDFLEDNLAKNNWLTGNKMTLCDLGCAATISSLQILIPASNRRHAKINQWMQRLEDLPCFKINKKGLERLNYFVKCTKPN